jgi:hypothetical protein
MQQAMKQVPGLTGLTRHNPWSSGAFASAEVTFANVERVFQRATDLLGTKAISRQEYDDAEARYREAEARFHRFHSAQEQLALMEAGYKSGARSGRWIVASRCPIRWTSRRASGLILPLRAAITWFPARSPLLWQWSARCSLRWWSRASGNAGRWKRYWRFLGTFSFIVPAVLLSGFPAPVENMPLWLQRLNWFNPIATFHCRRQRGLSQGHHHHGAPASHGAAHGNRRWHTDRSQLDVPQKNRVARFHSKSHTNALCLRFNSGKRFQSFSATLDAAQARFDSRPVKSAFEQDKIIQLILDHQKEVFSSFFRLHYNVAQAWIRSRTAQHEL